MKTRYNSYRRGKLCEGCKLCVEGLKSVLFITGLCSRDCFYCPLSEKKKKKDVVYINEKEVEKEEDVFGEIEKCDSDGVGITGGDPLLVMDRTVNYIKRLKEKFGKDFHIHLYTALRSVSKEKLSRLYDAGLDEIRFHPDFESKEYWDRVKMFREFDWDVGMEIPLIPGKEEVILGLVDFVKDYVDFINLNELEYSDNESYDLKGLKVKDELSYGIEGSVELGWRLMKKFRGVRFHLCTAKLKDSVQLTNRIIRRALNIREWYDEVEEDGILRRGAVYLMKPSFDYRKESEKIGEERLDKIKDELSFDCEVDYDKKRLLTSVENVHDNCEEIKSKGLVPCVVEEYPTEDKMEVEIDFL